MYVKCAAIIKHGIENFKGQDSSSCWPTHRDSTA